MLVDFNEFQVFRDAPGQHNMVIVLKKTKDAKGRSLILNLKSSELPEQEIVARREELFSSIKRNGRKSKVLTSV